MFSYKIVILKGIWIFFALALPTHVFDPFLSTLFYYRLISVRQHDLNRLVCTSSAGLHWTSLWRKGQSHDVAHEAWQRPYFERSWTYSLRSRSYPFATSQDISDP